MITNNMKLEANWRESKPPLIERYREFLPVSPETPIVSLQEGEPRCFEPPGSRSV